MAEIVKKLPKSRELVSRSWSAYKSNWRVFWKYLWLLILGSVAATILLSIEQLAIVGFLLAIGVAIYGVWVSIVLTRISYQTMENNKLNEKMALDNAWGRFWPVVGVGIVTGLVTFAGFMAFIVPGIVVGLMYFAAKYGVIIDNQKVHEAIYKSVELTRGRKMNLFWTLLWAYVIVGLIGLVMVIVLILIASAIQPAIGVSEYFVTQVPLSIAEMLFLPWALGIATGVYLALKKA